VNLGNVAFTLNTGREQFRHRLALVADNAWNAAQATREAGSAEVYVGQAASDAGAAFLFPGGGTQYAGMAAELYVTYRPFQEAADRCFSILKTRFGVDLKSLLFAGAAESELVASQLTAPSLGLPAIFTIEYALVQQLGYWGLHPSCMVGHSLGEYTAACVAGVFSLEDTLALVSLRGKLFESLPRGAMLSAYLSENEFQAIAPPGVSIAALNGPNMLVLSGSQESIERCGQILEQNGIENKRLHIEVAAHSPAVEPIMEELRRLLKRTAMYAPAIPFLSNLTGSWIKTEEACDPDYWVRHLRCSVRFANNVHNLGERGFSVALEVGPGNSLTSLVRSQLPQKSSNVVPTMSHPRRRVSEAQMLQRALAKAWVSGAEVDWASWHADYPCRRISLPTYWFERERYWIDPSSNRAATGWDGNSGPETGSIRLAGVTPYMAEPLLTSYPQTKSCGSSSAKTKWTAKAWSRVCNPEGHEL